MSCDVKRLALMLLGRLLGFRVLEHAAGRRIVSVPSWIPEQALKRAVGNAVADLEESKGRPVAAIIGKGRVELHWPVASNGTGGDG